MDWLWYFSAKEVFGFVMFAGCLPLAISLEPVILGREPNYYLIAFSLTAVGVACAMLVYHIRKGGEESTATKKKIILVWMAVSAPMGALAMLDTLWPLVVGA